VTIVRVEKVIRLPGDRRLTRPLVIVPPRIARVGFRLDW